MSRLAHTPFNLIAADLLRQCALLLREQNGNPFRANAYLRAAQTLEGLALDAREIMRERGVSALTELPFIGAGLASAIAEIASTGHLSRLDRLRGTADPQLLLQTVPGIGAVLAHRIHDELHVDTLEAFEVAAHDGRLEQLPGIGARRAAAARANLAALLGRAGASLSAEPVDAPPLEDLLDVDRQYLREAAAGTLPRIAPRRFNPTHETWLPILHTERGIWHFTALFSNTARAHQLGRTSDWVVVFFHDGDHREDQRTIVTETAGPLAGKRVVRGSEAACSEHYRSIGHARASRSAVPGPVVVNPHQTRSPDHHRTTNPGDPHEREQRARRSTRPGAQELSGRLGGRGGH